MFVVIVGLSAVLAMALAGSGGAKVADAPLMVANAEHLGYSRRAFRIIGSLELAAVAGLVTGVVWLPLRILTASGVAALLVAGAVSHARAGDDAAAVAPAAVLALAAAAVVALSIVQG